MIQATTTYIVLKELFGNPPPILSSSQQFLAPFAPELILSWKLLWTATAVFICALLIRDYVRGKL